MKITAYVLKIIFGLLIMWAVLFFEVNIFKIPEDYYSLLQIPFEIAYFGFLTFLYKEKWSTILLLGGFVYFIFSLLGNMMDPGGNILFAFPSFVIGFIIALIGWAVGATLLKLRVTNSIPSQSLPSTAPISSSNKPPYSNIWIIIVSVIFGPFAGYFAIWQNLKRIDQDNVAKQFLIYGALTILSISLVLNLLIKDGASFRSGSLDVIGLILPIWYYYKHGNVWQNQHPKVAKFQWSLIGYGTLGMMLFFVTNFIMAFLLSYI